MRLQLVEPRLEREDRFAAQVEYPQARIAGDALVCDEAGLQQDPQVAAHDGSGRPGGLSQLAGTPRSVTEKLDDSPPRRVGERREDRTDIVWHNRNSYLVV